MVAKMREEWICSSQIAAKGFSLGFFQGNGSSRNSAVYLVSIDAGKSCNKQGGKARKILQNGSPPPTIWEAILFLRLKEKQMLAGI